MAPSVGRCEELVAKAERDETVGYETCQSLLAQGLKSEVEDDFVDLQQLDPSPSIG